PGEPPCFHSRNPRASAKKRRRLSFFSQKALSARYLLRLMIRRDYLIVGAGAAGVAACEAIRAIDKRRSIMMITAEPHPGVRRPDLLPGILGPKESPIEKLLEKDPAWFSRHKIDLRLNTLVNQFSIEQRAAVLVTGQAVKFEKALLATGSRARRPGVAGATLGNVFYIRTARDLAA